MKSLVLIVVSMLTLMTLRGARCDSWSSTPLMILDEIDMSIMEYDNNTQVPGSPNVPANSKIILTKNSTTCTMYSKRCFVRIIVLEPALVRKSIKVKTPSKRIVEFKSIEACTQNNSAIRKECRAFDNYTLQYKTENFFLIRIRAKLVGIKNLEIEYVEPTSGSSDLDSATNVTRVKIYHRVIITRPERFIDNFQIVYIVVFSILISVIMGILLDLDTLIKIIKMPFPVLIGFISQYFIMPMLTYGFIHLFNLPPVEALALFIYGCSPGGSSSNNWTIIFNGDIDLSAMMTFVSTMTSIFMMPLWMYTLGRRISYKAEVTIPIEKLVYNLLTTIIPCIIGLILSQRFPILKAFFMRIAKKLVIILIISFLLVTLAAKYYVFNLVTLEQWVTGPLIPWTGFLLGAFLAWVTRRPLKQIFTISIETGMQNVGIAYLIIMLNFPSPQSDYALLPLIAISTITTVPLWVLLFVKMCLTNMRKVLREYRGKEDADHRGAAGDVDVGDGLLDKKNLNNNNNNSTFEQKLNSSPPPQQESNTPV